MHTAIEFSQGEILAQLEFLPVINLTQTTILKTLR